MFKCVAWKVYKYANRNMQKEMDGKDKMCEIKMSFIAIMVTIVNFIFLPIETNASPHKTHRCILFSALQYYKNKSIVFVCMWGGCTMQHVIFFFYYSIFLILDMQFGFLVL